MTTNDPLMHRVGGSTRQATGNCRCIRVGIVHQAHAQHRTQRRLRSCTATGRNAHAFIQTIGLRSKRTSHSVDTRFVGCEDDRNRGTVKRSNSFESRLLARSIQSSDRPATQYKANIKPTPSQNKGATHTPPNRFNATTRTFRWFIIERSNTERSDEERTANAVPRRFDLTPERSNANVTNDADCSQEADAGIKVGRRSS